MTQHRQFTHRTAVRERSPLFVGVSGPSGSGKTKSALRIADGFRRVDGRKVFGIDTENHRMEHYASEHTFEHVAFAPPHGPDDYIDAINYCVEQGAGTIVIDSMSHEHEGTGGVLEIHAAEVERLGGGDRNNFSAWIKPKAARKRLVNAILQCPANIIACFRSREKMQPVKGGQPLDLGWMPIAPDEYVYEMHVNLVFMPMSNGTPTWNSNMPGEKRVAKLPGQFRDLLIQSPQIDENIGEQLARWAAGGAVKAKRQPPRNAQEHLERYASCADREEFEILETARKAAWGKMSSPVKEQFKAAADLARERLDADAAANAPPDGAAQ
ncbi:MAG TPA: AAA family ATPase [Candidatus Binatia bacterium]|nr:AAA family ATPase [Candidatus Binatia bacterium]